MPPILSRLVRSPLLLAAVLGSIGCGASAGSSPSLVLTALGNDGFLIECGDHAVLVDALYVGFSGYEAPSAAELAARAGAVRPFNRVDLVLATHHHPDHFDPRPVRDHLAANQAAVFVSTAQAVELVRQSSTGSGDLTGRVRAVALPPGGRESLVVNDIAVEALDVSHGRRDPPVHNLGFLVRIGGYTVLHVGDWVSDPEDLAAFRLADERVDVALIPYWHLLDNESAAAVVTALGTRTVVAMHLPAVDAPASYFEPAANLAELIQRLEGVNPDLVRLAGTGDRLEVGAR